jgi:hypothetical protein
MSHRESIWIPKRFSISVLSFFVLAIFPSNISHRPDSARHNTARSRCPFNDSIIPPIEIHRLIYVSITV